MSYDGLELTKKKLETKDCCSSRYDERLKDWFLEGEEEEKEQASKMKH